MFALAFHLPVLFSRRSFRWNLFQLYSFSLFIPVLSSLAPSDDQALTIVQSIDEYICQNYALTCFFRQRHHQSNENDARRKSLDFCKSLLILHSCLHYDADTRQVCSKGSLNRAKIHLTRETPEHCQTSSVYKTYYAQHLHSFAPSSSSRIFFKWQIIVLLDVILFRHLSFG